MKIEMIRGKADVPARFWESCYIENSVEYFDMKKQGYYLRDNTDVVCLVDMVFMVSQSSYTSWFHEGKTLTSKEFMAILLDKPKNIAVPEFHSNSNLAPSRCPSMFKYEFHDGFFFKLPNPRF